MNTQILTRLKKELIVNLEFDVLGKYVAKLLELGKIS